mgnify:CR=1 FL=1
MKLVISYEVKDDHPQFIISIYLFRYIRVFKMNVLTYVANKLDEYLKEDDNSSFSTKSYINYKNLVKIIWYRYKEIIKHMKIHFIDLRIWIGTNDPAQGAIIYGALNGIIPNLIHLLNGLIPVENYYIRILPDFSRTSSKLSFICEIYVNPIFITYQYISIKRRLKAND